MTAVRIKFDRFPGGLSKAATFSFDDGRDHDRRLVAIMNQYGLKGTFHLNSGKFGLDGYLKADEVNELYEGHEISAHTVTHPFLDQTPDEQIIEEIRRDRETLEELAGYPVRGMSYPFGTYDDRVLAMLPTLGIEYSRTVQSHGGFGMPADPLRWHPTCHHKGMIEATERFLQANANRLQVLFIWGHSYEFENDNNWELMEQIGELLQGNDSIWFSTMADIIAYQRAVSALRFSVDRRIVQNPSAIEVWFSADGESVKVGPGETVRV